MIHQSRKIDLGATVRAFLRNGTAAAGDDGAGESFGLMSCWSACSDAIFCAICCCVALSCTSFCRTAVRSWAMLFSCCADSKGTAPATGAGLSATDVEGAAVRVDT